ncbi:MAG: PQQ-binding-like beta-propeller repeat protein [Thermodesulfobacteriota bacterium]
MSKRKINAKQAVRDILLGLSDSEMMEKYELSSRGLQSLFEKLIAEGLVEARDVDERVPLHSRTVTVDLYRCPACQMPQFEPFDVCPQCGVIVTKFRTGDQASKPRVSSQGKPSEFAPAPALTGEPAAPGDVPPATLDPLSDIVVPEMKLGDIPEADPLPIAGRGIKKAGLGSAPAAPILLPSFLDRRIQRSKGETVVPVTQISGLKWKFKTEGQIFASPVITDGVVIFGSWDGILYAVELATGNEMWRFQTEGAIHASAAVAYGTVFFGSLDGFFYALDLLTGKEEWRFETGAPIYSSPTVVGGFVYFTSYNGTLYALESASGELHWHYDTHKASRSAPAIFQKVVCFGCNDGYMYAIE